MARLSSLTQRDPMTTAGLVLSRTVLPMTHALALLTAGVAVANGIFDYATALLRARFADRLYFLLVSACK